MNEKSRHLCAWYTVRALVRQVGLLDAAAGVAGLRGVQSSQALCVGARPLLPECSPLQDLEKPLSSPQQPAFILASGLMDRAMPHEPCSGSQEGPSLQLQRSEPLVSEGDAQELRQILRKLKSLALDTETELERQDDVLDGITAAIDRTTLTIDKHNQRTKKLT
ncbi:synaptosomal-associated protein 47-like isoform X3 [Canis lupus familiaris]|uniref:synaptosomal-associated protein 47-like isoform X1 n=1 Tax=Canis lupus dingo TaxID=286419 RepID=UPI000DC6B657|nr:synaptosomal-associated protein 47-like isoform X1 [Canis lupus dingo]XP_038412326.1 synaptosomal-associated protein 47-like isoform X3 [Canis lupus familiaris]XP_038541956.1 synaptosomal-associated protein 47-like isoform X1 [Canis lupus familiaris]